MNKNFVGILFGILYSFSAAVFAAVPGTLDTTFNLTGIQAGTESTTISNSTSNSNGQAVAIQADGNIVVAGIIGGSPGDFGVARFLANGGLDTTFNGSGAQPGTIKFAIGSSALSQAQAVAMQADGKIVVAGTEFSGLFVPSFAVARLDTNGTLDSGFNSGGTQSVSFGSGSSLARAVAVQSDGKIVLAGVGAAGFAVARLNTNGTLDTTTFNSGGTEPGTNSTTVDGMTNDGCRSIAIQTDGKIVVAGFAGDGSTIGKFGVARFNTDGTLDPTFNAGGTLPGTNSTSVENSTAFGNSANAVAIQSNGKIVLGGVVAVSGVNKFGLAQFNTNGTLDTTFNAGSVTQPGTVSTTIQNSTSASGASVAIQENGKIIIAGSATVSGVSNFGIARFLANGTLDTTFNPDSLIQPGTNATLIDNTNGSANGNSVGLQSDGQIVMAGEVLFSGGSPANKFAVARFNGGEASPVPPVVTTTTTTDPFALRLIQKYGPRL